MVVLSLGFGVAIRERYVNSIRVLLFYIDVYKEEKRRIGFR